MNIAIDWGNTRVKIGAFEDQELQSEWVFEGDGKKMIDRLKSHLQNTGFQLLGWAASGEVRKEARVLLQQFGGWEFTRDAQRAHTSVYSTPETLGPDRILNMEAAISEFSGQNTLVIDMGTCITYDLLDAEGVHRGGSISPGWSMRHRAMSAFTARLPAVENARTDLVEHSTRGALQSGAYNGMLFELQGTIHAYESRFSDLNVVVTGGDYLHFDLQAKKTIFARPNFTLQGLNAITIRNAHKHKP